MFSSPLANFSFPTLDREAQVALCHRRERRSALWVLPHDPADYACVRHGAVPTLGQWKVRALGSVVFVIEVAPSPDGVGARRGVVAEGPVGSRLAGCFRLFRYEVRCWANGAIPDINQAVASPIGLNVDPNAARRVLELAPYVPTGVWGRDEAGTGEMWTSNPVVSWLLASSGLAAEEVPLPPNGRAPGWDAGLVSARASRRTASRPRVRAAGFPHDYSARPPNRRRGFSCG